MDVPRVETFFKMEAALMSPTIDALTDIPQKSLRRFSSQLDMTSPNEVQTKKGLDVIDIELLKSEFDIDFLDLNQVFTCSLENTTNNGRLLITPRLLGYIGQDQQHITKIKIHLHDIVNVEKRNTSSVFPNAIRIYTTQNFYTFVSFLKRNAAHKLIHSCWENACREYATTRGENLIKIPLIPNINEELIIDKSTPPEHHSANSINNSSSLTSKLLGVESIKPTRSMDSLNLPTTPERKTEPTTPAKLLQAMNDVIEIKTDKLEEEKKDVFPLPSANDQVKTFWNNMGKSLQAIQVQITEKTKPKLKPTGSSMTVDIINTITEYSRPPSAPKTTPDAKKLKPVINRTVLIEKELKLKAKYVYRYLFESPLLQRTLQAQGASELEISHWSEGRYSDELDSIKCNQRTINYKIQRPTEVYKYSDVHYLVETIDNEK